MDHLCASEGFHEQGDLASAMRTDEPKILANTDSFGGHVCTWVRTSKAGYTVRTKVYNKVVSNLEAGEIREPIGGHLADWFPGFPLGPARSVCSPTARQAVGEPGRMPRPSRPAAGLDIRGLVGAHDDRSGLGSLGPATKAHIDKEETWERAVEWAAADFGFRACPIFWVDILGANEEGVELGPLRCYFKDADAGTILAASKRPTQLHPKGPDPGTLLPPSTSVSWV